MSSSPSLRDTKFKGNWRSRKKTTHTGQAFASARKKGLNTGGPGGLRERAFGRKEFDDENDD